MAGVAAAIMLFATIAAVTASMADPKIRPAGVIFSDDRQPLCGLFIAQNADHLYIGEAVENSHIPHIGVHSEGRIVDLPRDSVMALVLGSSQSLGGALDRAPRMLKKLVKLNNIDARAARPQECHGSTAS